MKYSVRITPEAQANITAAYEYIAERSPINAARWLRALYKQMDGLEEFPRRFGAAREQAHIAGEIRQAIVKSYRIVFTIDDAEATVHVVYVRHAKRRAVGDPGNGGP